MIAWIKKWWNRISAFLAGEEVQKATDQSNAVKAENKAAQEIDHAVEQAPHSRADTLQRLRDHNA